MSNKKRQRSFHRSSCVVKITLLRVCTIPWLPISMDKHMPDFMGLSIIKISCIHSNNNNSNNNNNNYLKSNIQKSSIDYKIDRILL